MATGAAVHLARPFSLLVFRRDRPGDDNEWILAGAQSAGGGVTKAIHQRGPCAKRPFLEGGGKGCEQLGRPWNIARRVCAAFRAFKADLLCIFNADV